MTTEKELARMATQPINNVDKERRRIVYVVTAIDDGRVKDQLVFASLFEANETFKRLIQVYGGANVVLASRMVQ